MENTSLDLEGFRKLLNSYPGYTVGESTPPTLMEIAGFPHWENVYSNILAFLLDTGEAHCFGSLFVQSMLAAYQRHCPDEWPGKHLLLEIDRETDHVFREKSTKEGRIDILVECSDFVICIENKIWSELRNDLGEYREYCENHIADKRPVLGIVLSPIRFDRQVLEENEFVNVTYSDYAEELRHRSGDYIGRHNTQYQYLLFDFVEQASRFGGDKTMTDDQRRFLEFWRDNDKKIRNIQSMCGDLWGELRAREKAQAHINKCQEALKHLNPSYNELFDPWIYKGHVAVFDLIPKGASIDQCRVFLDVEFYPTKVSQVLGNRGETEPPTLASRASKLASRVSKMCDCNIAFEPHEWDNGKSSGRQVFHDENSPFEKEVCDEAVKNSVNILKALADLYLEQKKSLIK